MLERLTKRLEERNVTLRATRRRIDARNEERRANIERLLAHPGLTGWRRLALRFALLLVRD